MVDDRIREKLANLIRLAKRPGTPQEGEAARAAAIRLSLKYGIVCEFTAGGKTSARPTASAPPQDSQQATPDSADTIFYQWVKHLNAIGWLVHNHVETKIGPQLRFRKPGYNAEVRVTQRRGNGGNDFEAEHIMKPDLVKGLDRSYCAYLTIDLRELIRHLGAK